jgi:hypothetical protein
LTTPLKEPASKTWQQQQDVNHCLSDRSPTKEGHHNSSPFCSFSTAKSLAPNAGRLEAARRRMASIPNNSIRGQILSWGFDSGTENLTGWQVMTIY